VFSAYRSVALRVSMLAALRAAVLAFGSNTPPPIHGHCASFRAISLAELPGFTGCATLVSMNGTYSGSLVDGRYEGAGTMWYAATNVDDGAVHPALTVGDVYTGGWRAGMRHGPGTLERCADKAVCGIWATVFAQWVDGTYSGSTVQIFKSDFCIRRLTGETRLGAVEGMLSSGFVMGTFVYADGATYVGEMQDSMRGIYLDGYGTLTSASGSKFSGVWEMDTVTTRKRSQQGFGPMNSSDVLGCCTAGNAWCSY